MKRLIKYTDKDSGVAIMFSLMMLAVFLVLGMGFSAYMSNVRRAATYQQGVSSDTDIFAILDHQVKIAMASGFADSDYSGSSLFASSFPEGAPSKYATGNFTTVPGGSTVSTNEGNTLAYPMWGIRAITPDHNLDDSDVYFTFQTPDTSTTNLYIEPDSFTSPFENSRQGWQEHYEGYQGSEENGDPLQAISTWQVIGLSGRLNPNGGYINGPSNPSSRAFGISPSEMSLQDLGLTSNEATAVFDAKIYTTFLDFYTNYKSHGTAPTMNDTVYFSFFPMPTTDELERVSNTLTLSQTHKAANGNTLFDLSSVASSTPEIIAGISGSTPLSYLADSTVLTAEQRVQIAANLKDYVDSDSVASTDYPATNPPTYVGNELVPYINEVKFIASATYGKLGGFLTDATLDIDVQVELANIYDNIPVLTATDEVTLKFTVEYNIQATSISGPTTSPEQTVSIKGNEFTTFTAEAAPYSSRGYYNSPILLSVPVSFNQTFTPGLTPINATNDKITGIKVTLTDAVVLKNGSDTMDIGTPINTTTDTVEVLDGFNAYCSAQVNDPKFNHSASEWSALTWQAGDSGTGDSIGNVNVATVSNTDGDKEPDNPSNPLLYSTNYIRNGVLLNLHELGYIHRGSPHRTLNLVEYNMVSPNSINNYTNTGTDPNLYSETDGGDRSILDYVSLGSAAVGNVATDDANITTAAYDDSYEETIPNKGRINPNTYNRAVFKMLFSNISADHPTSSTDRVGNAGTAITDAKLSLLMKRFPGFETQTQDYTPGSTWPSIGYFDTTYFNNFKNNPPSYGLPFKLALDNDELNDREAEVLIGNTRRLVSINQTYYLAYQEVRQSPNGYSPTDRLTSTSETKKEVYYIRDLIDTNTTPTYDDFTDDQYKIRKVNEVIRP